MSLIGGIQSSDVVARWVNPKHISDDAVRDYQEALKDSSMRLVVIQDYLLESAAQRMAQFFMNEAIYRTERRLYSPNPEGRSVDEAEWMRATDEDRFYAFDVFASAQQQFAVSGNLMTYLKFMHDLPTPPFMGYYSRLLGLPVSGVESSVHSMRPGHYLKMHNDDLRNRCFAFVLYLSVDWQPSYGGSLTLIDRADSNLVRVEPKYNTLVLFDVTLGTKHAVEPILPAAEHRARVSLGGWFIRAE
jgi:Rps23 Pro-64 3,4-dihydroxylase Tpa1-like proline 4-hydroxylase